MRREELALNPAQLGTKWALGTCSLLGKRGWREQTCWDLRLLRGALVFFQEMRVPRFLPHPLPFQLVCSLGAPPHRAPPPHPEGQSPVVLKLGWDQGYETCLGDRRTAPTSGIPDVVQTAGVVAAWEVSERSRPEAPLLQQPPP